MRRVVCSVSSNVQLPVLPEARMDIRNGICLPWAAASLLYFWTRIFAAAVEHIVRIKAAMQYGNACFSNFSLQLSDRYTTS